MIIKIFDIKNLLKQVSTKDFIIDINGIVFDILKGFYYNINQITPQKDLYMLSTNDIDNFIYPLKIQTISFQSYKIFTDTNILTLSDYDVNANIYWMSGCKPEKLHHIFSKRDLILSDSYSSCIRELDLFKTLC